MAEYGVPGPSWTELMQAQNGSPTTCEGYGAATYATAAQNLDAIQSALNQTGTVSLLTPGTYTVSDSFTGNPLTTALLVGRGVTLQTASGGTVTTLQPFINSGGYPQAAQSIPWAYNLRLSQIAQSRQRAGAANFKLACIGDSTTAGLPGDGTFTGRTTSYPTVLNGLLGNIGQTARVNSAFGEPTNTFNNTNFTTYDSRWTLGANWTLSAIGVQFPRQLLFNNAVATNLTFTPATSCDTYEVYYITAPSYGTVTIASAGASPSTINMAAALGIGKATITVTAGQPLIITPPISTQVNVCAVIGYTAATREISVINMGQGGLRATYASDRTSLFTLSYLYDAIQPTLSYVCLGINDWLSSVPVATFQTSINSIVTQLQAIGSDVVLVSPFPSGITNTALATQRQFENAIRTVALNRNVEYVNLFDFVGSYEISNPLGYYQAGQTVHPSVSGYDFMGRSVFNNMRATYF